MPAFLLALVLVLVAPSAALAKNRAPAIDVTNENALYALLCSRVAADFDSAAGGFVEHGVPDQGSVELAFAQGQAQSDWTRRGVQTVDWSRALFDTLSGGYYEKFPSADDRGAGIDKRADTNARRLENLMQAWRATQDDRYRHDA